LDEINRLKEKVKQLEEQNKKLIPEELAQKIETYEKEIAELKSQLEKLTSQQQTAQVEFPPKENKIKSFFKFGSK
jgi:signal transduction histidine kinase